MASPSRVEVLTLFRSLLRTARDFPDYNIREYTKRRTIDGFRQNKDLSDPSKVTAAFSDGRAQLEVAKRQAVVYSLYAPKDGMKVEEAGKKRFLAMAYPYLRPWYGLYMVDEGFGKVQNGWCL